MPRPRGFRCEATEGGAGAFPNCLANGECDTAVKPDNVGSRAQLTGIQIRGNLVQFTSETQNRSHAQMCRTERPKVL